MGMIDKFMSGEITAEEFISIFMSDIMLRKEIDMLVPEDAVGNPEHEIWNGYSYDALNTYGFSLSRLILERGKFNGSLGDNLNLFSCIQHFYGFNNPYLCCTTYYMDIFVFALSLTQDCFDGEEVTGIIESIAHKYLDMTPKTKRNKEAKEEIKKVFHVDKKRPHWIQAPEWPMGKCTPMIYIDRKKDGEEVDCYFKDADTGEIRIIRQYY